jgi:hypothetical protein
MLGHAAAHVPPPPIASPHNLRYHTATHKDPVKPRVALLAADPPDNT